MTSAHEHAHPTGSGSVLWIFVLPFVVAVGGYLAAATIASRRGRPWPWMRSYFWVLGCTVAFIGLLSPLVIASLAGFVGHMAAHLMAGMVAPLLLVLAAPFTLALRALDVVPARRVSRILRSGPARLLMNPVVATMLNVGSMWALYFTPLYNLAEVPFFHLLLMMHFLAVGYLFTASIASIDPNPHRWSIRARGIVLLLALAAHGVLAKMLYAHPLPGVERGDVELAAQLMFYGGDLVDLTLLIVLCAQWYRASGRRIRSPGDEPDRAAHEEAPSRAQAAPPRTAEES